MLRGHVGGRGNIQGTPPPVNGFFQFPFLLQYVGAAVVDGGFVDGYILRFKIGGGLIQVVMGGFGLSQQIPDARQAQGAGGDFAGVFQVNQFRFRRFQRLQGMLVAPL